MKKFLWIIIALLVVAMIVGCGQQAAKGKKFLFM
jgi:predicted small lipoprotein YifL